MNAHQPMLLNTSLMTSTKRMNAVRRARGKAGYTSETARVLISTRFTEGVSVTPTSAMQPSSKSYAGTVAAPAPTPPRSQTKSPARLNVEPITPQDCEFNFPDEDRVLKTLDGFGFTWCQNCHEYPALQRNRLPTRNQYRVGCPGRLKPSKDADVTHSECPDPSPWSGSSSHAINHWKLVQKILSRNL